jgi:hypothetical protein
MTETADGGCQQKVIWKMSVDTPRGATCLLSLYARAKDVSGPLTVRPESKDGGMALAEQKIAAIGKEWTKFVRALTAEGGGTAARLALAAEGKGTLRRPRGRRRLTLER